MGQPGAGKTYLISQLINLWLHPAVFKPALPRWAQDDYVRHLPDGGEHAAAAAPALLHGAASAPSSPRQPLFHPARLRAGTPAAPPPHLAPPAPQATSVPLCQARQHDCCLPGPTPFTRVARSLTGVPA